MQALMQALMQASSDASFGQYWSILGQYLLRVSIQLILPLNDKQKLNTCIHGSKL